VPTLVTELPHTPTVVEVFGRMIKCEFPKSAGCMMFDQASVGFSVSSGRFATLLTYGNAFGLVAGFAVASDVNAVHSLFWKSTSWSVFR